MFLSKENINMLQKDIPVCAFELIIQKREILEYV